MPGVAYKTVQGFFSLKGFSEAGMPTSSGSCLACSAQYRIRSDDALDTCEEIDPHTEQLHTALLEDQSERRKRVELYLNPLNARLCLQLMHRPSGLSYAAGALHF